MNTTKIEKLNACSEATAWLKTQHNAQTAWNNCKRGDWMLWLLGALDKSEPWSDGRKPLAACCADVAALALPYINADTELATLWCIDSLRRWANGSAERDEAEAARSATYAAAYTYAATYAAAAAYAAAYAADTAAYAYAATYTATAAAAYAYADTAARAKALADSADIVRAHFPRAPRLP